METAVVSMRMPASLVEALDRRADSEQRSRANMATVLIRSGLAEPADKANEEKP